MVRIFAINYEVFLLLNPFFNIVISYVIGKLSANGKEASANRALGGSMHPS